MIRKLNIVITCVLFINFSYAQKKDKSEIYYNMGNAAFAQKNYKKADSLFTLSISLQPHPDTYFNLAACKKKLDDFEGYCINLGGAMNMGDVEARRLYSKQCIKSDTLKSKEIIGDSIIKVIKLITTYLYNDNIECEKYDKDTNLMSSFFIQKNDTIYNYDKGIEFIPSTSGDSSSSLVNFIKQTHFAEFVKTNNSTGKIVLSIIYNKDGIIENIQTISSAKNQISENELISELYKQPKTKGITIKGVPVKYNLVVTVIFAKKLLYVWCNETPKRIKRSFRISSDKEMLKNDEIMPEFPGGTVDMMQFLQKNIVYPNMAKEAGLQGKCFLKFVVGVDGSINDVAVMRGVPGCIECDIEAIRVVYSMPKWNPGKQKGKAVPVFFNLPINFHLR